MSGVLRPGGSAETSRGDLDWHDDAACKGYPLSLFFAPDVDLSTLSLDELGQLAAERKHNEAAARRICMSCPVRRACLEWRLGFEHQRDGGIWGGLDEEQRWALHRNRVRSAAAKRRRAS
jgi:WhiB family redox-sensing transcriptional regulator